MVRNPEEKKIHVLLVDDDNELQADIRDYLEPYGCKLSTQDDGRGIENALEQLRPDIVLLDVMLPGDDGFTILRRLRVVSPVPVIMLTARGNDTDRIVGLEMGADDYVPKPFNPRELLARIKAVLRRGITPAPAHDMLVSGPYRLDLRQQRLHCGGNVADLTITEFHILQAFMRREGDLLTRDELLTLAFGENYYGSDRNIDVYISRVRNTLRGLGENSRIRTVWGSGYRWVIEAGEE